MIENFTPQPHPLYASWYHLEEHQKGHDIDYYARYDAGRVIGWRLVNDGLEPVLVPALTDFLFGRPTGYRLHDTLDAAMDAAEAGPVGQDDVLAWTPTTERNRT